MELVRYTQLPLVERQRPAAAPAHERHPLMTGAKRRGTRTATLSGHADAASEALRPPVEELQWPAQQTQQRLGFAVARGHPTTKLVGCHSHGAIAGTISASAALQAVGRTDNRARRPHELDIIVDGKHLTGSELMAAANRKPKTSVKHLEVYDRTTHRWVSLTKLTKRKAAMQPDPENKQAGAAHAHLSIEPVQP